MPDTNAANDQARIRWTIIDALRRYGTDSSRLGHAFAELHQLQPADLRALVAIMSAEGNGAPLTAGQLRGTSGCLPAGPAWSSTGSSGPVTSAAPATTPPTTASSTSATPTRAGLPVSPSLARSATAPTPS